MSGKVALVSAHKCVTNNNFLSQTEFEAHSKKIILIIPQKRGQKRKKLT